MPDFGKRIRQVANERWDLPDAAAALMEIIASTISRAEAGDLGVAEGVLSRSEVEFEEPSPGVYQLRLGGCLLYGCKPDDTPSNLATALPVLYDPTNTDQIQSTVEITDLDGTEGAIWWSVALAPTDLANRRVWESGYPDGRIQPLLTREYARVTFAATVGNNFNTPPATPGTWYRFAAVDFNANPPTVVLCHALDYGFENNAFQVAAGTVSANYWLGQVALANRDAASNSGRSYSVARLITQLAFSHLTTLDSDITYNVETGELTNDGSGAMTLVTTPTSGVHQLADQSAALAAAVEVLQENYKLAYWARVNDDATVAAEGGAIIDTAFATVAITSGGAGIFNVNATGNFAPTIAQIVIVCAAADSAEPRSFARCRRDTLNTASCKIYTYGVGSDTPADRAFDLEIWAQSTDY
ncbi:MAG: hypothetical protein IT477_10800 [Rhodanobacteraceae bacterium]|nr:hypothetical protein [Rhodanobacteraceae bacterium]